MTVVVKAHMDSNDRNLGMGSNITRRDFLNGVAVTVGAKMIPGVLRAQSPGPDPSPAGAATGSGTPRMIRGTILPKLDGCRQPLPAHLRPAHEMRARRQVGYDGR